MRWHKLPVDSGRGEAILNIPIWRYQIIRLNSTGKSGKVGGSETNGQRCIDERDSINPPDRQHAQDSKERKRGNHQCTGTISANHDALAIDAINPGTDR